MPSSIYRALDEVAISSHRVTNPRSIPGKIEDLPPSGQWAEVDHTPEGVLYAWRRTEPHRLVRWRTRGYQSSISVALTRIIYDDQLAFSHVIDRGFDDARELPGWTETAARASWNPLLLCNHSMQSGTYLDDTGNTLHTATAYTTYARGNVGYLLDVTGTTSAGDRDGADLDILVSRIHLSV